MRESITGNGNNSAHRVGRFFCYHSRMEQLNSHSEPLPAILSVGDNRVQIELAKCAYRAEHGETSSDRNEIMLAWIADHHADEYRDYVVRHADERVTLNDIEALYRIICEKSERPDSATIH
jgi:hypothetical protein